MNTIEAMNAKLSPRTKKEILAWKRQTRSAQLHHIITFAKHDMMEYCSIKSAKTKQREHRESKQKQNK